MARRAIRITGKSDLDESKLKPVYVMQQKGVTPDEKAAVMDCLNEILSEAGVDGVIEVKDFGEWHQNDSDYGSAEWYVQKGREMGRQTEDGEQLNASTMVSLCASEPWREKEDHYDLFVCSSDLWEGFSNNNFVIGLALRNNATVLSVARFRHPELDARTRRECVKTEVMHELGHVFGLVTGRGRIEMSLGTHCADRCTMRQGITVPDDWVPISQDRLRYGAFCKTCREDLRGYFRK